MMIFFKPAVFLFCALFFAQCSPGEVSDDIPRLLPLDQSTEVSDLTLYTTGMEFIKLEEGEDSFLSYIKKLLIDKNGNFIVADMSGTVKVFDAGGRFLFHVGRQGRGPGEYVRAADVSLDDTGDNIFVMSIGHVLVYNASDGRYLRQIEIPRGKDFEAICASNDGGYYLFSCNPGPEDLMNFDKEFFALSRFDADGSLVEESLPRKDFVITQGIFTQSYDAGYLLRPQEGDNILYKVAGNNVLPQYHIDFGDRAIPAKYMFEGAGNPWGNIQKFIRSDYYKMPVYFQNTENGLYFACAGPQGNYHHFIYSFPEMKAIHWEDKVIDPAPTLMMASDSEHLYAMIVGLEKYLESNESELNPLTRVIIQEFKKREITWRSDNPVLVKIKFGSVS